MVATCHNAHASSRPSGGAGCPRNLTTRVEPLYIPKPKDRRIEVSLIDVGDRRRESDPEAVEALATDMARHDLLQPIGVRKLRSGERYQLIWGAGRLPPPAS